MPTRDSRAEARKAWRLLRKMVLPLRIWPSSTPEILEILESLARREYEAGYRDGHEDQMRFRVRDELDRKGAPCWYCCECSEMKNCLHTKIRCANCVAQCGALRELQRARRRG